MFVGFDSTELKTIVLKKFVSNTNFQSANNSETFDSIYVAEFYGDTAHKPYCQISFGFDWEIEIPKASKIFRISNIQLSPAKDPYCGGWVAGERFCSKPVISLQINGLQIPVSNDSYRYQTLYFYK
jgi:hypothetical protein